MTTLATWYIAARKFHRADRSFRIAKQMVAHTDKALTYRAACEFVGQSATDYMLKTAGSINPVRRG